VLGWGFYIPENQILEPFIQDRSKEPFDIYVSICLKISFWSDLYRITVRSPLEYRLLEYRISVVGEFPYSRRPHSGAAYTESQ
jgi:hypothetical protein